MAQHNIRVWLLLETISGKLDSGVTMQIRPQFMDGITLSSRNSIQKQNII